MTHMFAGWCPPNADMTARDTWAFAVQEASWQNHAFIASVPNRGIKFVRIHSLLNMVVLKEGAAHSHPVAGASFNFSLLHNALDMVVYAVFAPTDSPFAFTFSVFLV